MSERQQNILAVGFSGYFKEDADFSLWGDGPFKARSASDRTVDWPFWYVENAIGVNAMSGQGGAVFTNRENAVRIAENRNARNG